MMPGSTVNILGVRVAARPARELVSTIVDWAREPQPHTGPRLVFATSVHGLVEASRDHQFRGVLNSASLVVPDGLPLLWFGRLRGLLGMERLRGTDLMRAVCRATAATPVRHFLYGAGPGVAERLAAMLVQAYPGITVAGCSTPPCGALSEAERHSLVPEINASRADIVWVGLGTPKQERWATEMRASLRAKMAITVGAAFDFLTGTVREAPRIFQRSGLEWAYRLAREPRRLGSRYLINNPKFLVLAAAQLLGLVEFDDRTA